MRATDTTRGCKVSADLRFIGISFFLAVFLAAPSSNGHAAGSAWKPKKNVVIIAPAGPGGGNDKVARVIQKVFQDRNLVEANVVVMNKPGGSGEVAWSFLNQYAGDGSYLAVAPNTLLTNHITRDKALTYTDVTPVAVLAAEYNGFLVRRDSPIKSGRDLLEQVRKDPASVSIGLGLGPGAPSHVVLSMVIKAVGGDVRKAKLVSFKSAPDAISALLGGHVDMVVTNAADFTGFLDEYRP